MSVDRRGWNRGWDVKGAALGLFLVAAGLVLLRRDEAAFDALPALASVPTTVVTAADDRLTPATHGQRIAEALGPRARLLLVDGAGHAVNWTHHEVVDAALLDLVDRLRFA